jgi:ribose 5-phosphate isomerase A
MLDQIDPAKDAVGRTAAQLVESGMRLGLGSGSTFLRFLEHLARRVKEEGLDVVGVPSSEGTAARARELGVPLTTLDQLQTLDLTVDGADEVDPNKHMIKGGGAALAREKIIAAAADEMIVMVGENKMVEVLGRAFLLPVEVMQFGWTRIATRLRELHAEPLLRLQEDQPLITDNGNYILDCRFENGIPDPVALEGTINLIPGVLDNGLFTNLAGRILISDELGKVRVVS